MKFEIAKLLSTCLWGYYDCGFDNACTSINGIIAYKTPLGYHYLEELISVACLGLKFSCMHESLGAFFFLLENMHKLSIIFVFIAAHYTFYFRNGRTCTTNCIDYSLKVLWCLKVTYVFGWRQSRVHKPYHKNMTVFSSVLEEKEHCIIVFPSLNLHCIIFYFIF